MWSVYLLLTPGGTAVRSLYFEMGLGGKTGKGGWMGTFVLFKEMVVGKGKESWPRVNRTCRGVTAVVVEVGDGGM